MDSTQSVNDRAELSCESTLLPAVAEVLPVAAPLTTALPRLVVVVVSATAVVVVVVLLLVILVVVLVILVVAVVVLVILVVVVVEVEEHQLDGVASKMSVL